MCVKYKPKLIAIILIMVSIFVACKNTTKIIEQRPKSSLLPLEISGLTYPLEITPALSAHRGGKHIDDYPENCLETFKYITQSYPMIIECDVTLTTDGIHILMHDNSIDRTTTGSGKVQNLNYSQIKSHFLLDHKGQSTPYKVPLLVDVLNWAKGKAILSLDLKQTVNKPLLLDLLNKYKAYEFAEIITYNFDDAVYFSEHAPQYTLSVNIRNEKELLRFVNSDIDLSKLKPFVGTRRKDPSFYAKLHEQGFLVTLGTLGNIDKQAKSKGFNTYDNLISEGVDIFATDYPLEVAKYFYEGKISN